MNLRLLATSRLHRLALLPLVALLVVAGTPACGKSAAAGAVSCPPLAPEGGLPPYESVGSGTVHGAGVSADLCYVSVRLNETQGSPTGPYLLTLDANSPATRTELVTPADGVNGSITAAIPLSSLAPGVYASTDASLCGALSFSYGVPQDPKLDCAAVDASTGCPAGCTQSFVCTTYPCCVAVANTYVYQAGATAGCAGARNPVGSWSLTLSSAAGADAGDGSGLYLAHGTLTATLQGTSGTSDTLDLSISF